MTKREDSRKAAEAGVLERMAEFKVVYNDLEKYPTVSNVAEKFDISCKRVVNKAAEYRSLTQKNPSMPSLISRSSWDRPAVPLSEHTDKFKHWSDRHCVEELLRVQLLSPDQEITRNYFRNHSQISDSVWSAHFGTFEEFKRQSGLKLTRQQHGHERNIARHVSVDHYRKLNERLDWDEKYVRDNGKRFKTILTCSDLHDIEIDPFYLRVLIDTARRVQPDIICFVGDIFDLPEFGKYGVDPREWDVVGRIKFAHENIFKPLREACPDAQFDFVEGNHEARLLRHLADATPALRSVLSDLHGFTVSKLFGLEQFEINYIAKADLASWSKSDFDKELRNNYKIYFDTVMCHHFPHARNMGLPGVNGHHHSHQVWSMFNPIYGPYEWHQMGAGHIRSASYCEGEKWHNGFALINVDTQTRSTAFDYIQITDFAISGGKWYHRDMVEEVDARVPSRILQ